MQRDFSDLAPHEVLALAVSVEAHNERRYRDWAVRFRTYDPGTSRLLDGLADEEANHKAFLSDHYLRLFGKPPPSVDPAEIRAGLEIPCTPDDQYFISTTVTARAILEAAVSVEVRARCFYQNVLDATEDPALLRIYKTLMEFEASHVDIMERRLRYCGQDAHDSDVPATGSS